MNTNAFGFETFVSLVGLSDDVAVAFIKNYMAIWRHEATECYDSVISEMFQKLTTYCNKRIVALSQIFGTDFQDELDSFLETNEAVKSLKKELENDDDMHPTYDTEFKHYDECISDLSELVQDYICTPGYEDSLEALSSRVAAWKDAVTKA